MGSADLSQRDRRFTLALGGSVRHAGGVNAFKPTLARLLDDRVIELVGPEAQSWLQGQITADISSLQPGDSHYALLLSAKGKVVSDLWVLAGDPWRIALPNEFADDAVDRLNRFLVMEDVDLEPSDARLLSIVGTIETTSEPRFAVNRFSAGVELLTTTAQAGAVLAKLGLEETDSNSWESARILAGRPRMGIDFGANTLPQEAGLKAAVSFDKGCYVGQEPVVMLEHRGKPPKRIVHFRAASAEAGDVVESNEKNVGVVTSVTQADDGVVGLARIKRRALEGDTPLLLRDAAFEYEVVEVSFP